MIGVDGGAGAAPGAGRRLWRDDTHCWRHIFIQGGASGRLSARERGKVAPSSQATVLRYWLVGREGMKREVCVVASRADRVVQKCQRRVPMFFSVFRYTEIFYIW